MRAAGGAAFEGDLDFDRGAAAGIPDLAAVDSGDGAAAHRTASMTAATVGTGVGDQRRGDLADALAVVLAEIFDRRLAVDAGEEEAWQERSGALLEALPQRLRGNGRSRWRRARWPAGSSSEPIAGTCSDFSSRWLRRNAASKAGSPYQAVSASSRTGWPSILRDEDVLGADVAVDQRELGARGRRNHSEDALGEFGVTLGGGAQIGIETESLDQVVGGEFCGDLGIVEGRGVDAAEEARDARGHSRIGAARQHLGLPEDEVVGRQVVEDDDAVLVALGHHRRARRRGRSARRASARRPRSGCARPGLPSPSRP